MSSDDWVVLDNGPLVQLADNLWRVEGALPRMQLKRCMTVVRRTDGSLIVHSPIALDDAGMAELEDLGPVEVILVPSGFHRMDAPRYRRRYPDARLLCPPGSRKRVEEVVAIDGDYRDYVIDDTTSLRVLDGVGGAEGVLIVRSQAGVTLVFNDAFFNVPHGTGLMGGVFRLLGSTGGPKVTRIFKTFVLKDKSEFRRCLLELADTPDLVRLVPGHGGVIEDGASKVLRETANGV